jgi:uncharacterized protein YpuA (DUF1002 family)
LLYKLPSIIPKVVREKVLTEWLQGLTRNKIAEINDIGEGTVTEIINGYRENNSDIDQQREFVLALKGEGTDLNLFASSIRLKRFIDKLGIDEKQLESFLDNVQEHCFKKHKETNDFIKSVNDACCMSNEMHCTAEELPRHIQQMEKESSLLTLEIRRKKAEETLMRMNYNMTESQIEELGKNGVLALNDKLRLTEHQLAEERYSSSQERDRLINQLGLERLANSFLKDELGNCHKKLYGDSDQLMKPHNRSRIPHDRM